MYLVLDTVMVLTPVAAEHVARVPVPSANTCRLMDMRSAEITASISIAGMDFQPPSLEPPACLARMEKFMSAVCWTEL
jgi:hypothetical protein